MGVIVAGLSPTEFASLDNVTLGGVTPAAVKHLTPDHFRLLTAEKLSAIPMESMSVLRIGQLPKEGSSVLDSSQVKFHYFELNFHNYVLFKHCNLKFTVLLPSTD